MVDGSSSHSYLSFCGLFWYSVRCNSKILFFSQPLRNAVFACSLPSHIPSLSFPPTNLQNQKSKSQDYLEYSLLTYAASAPSQTPSVQVQLQFLLPHIQSTGKKRLSPEDLMLYCCFPRCSSPHFPYPPSLPLLDARARFALLCADRMHHDLVGILWGV